MKFDKTLGIEFVSLSDMQALSGVAELDADTVCFSDRFHSSDSLLSAARAVKEAISKEDTRIKSFSAKQICVVWSEGTVVLHKEEGHMTRAASGMVTVTAWCGEEVMERVLKAIEERYAAYKTSDIRLYYTDNAKHVLYRGHELRSFGEFRGEYYPWLSPEYFDEYFASSSSILFLTGMPGTGKTSVLRHEILERQLNVFATYDHHVISNDYMFLDFVSDPDYRVMVIEDADAALTSRKRGDNDLISRFLNFSDGLIKMTDKKIIFTTNLDDFSQVDPALTREGRCFGFLESRSLTAEEARAAALVAGITGDVGPCTIAELFNRRVDTARLARERVGF